MVACPRRFTASTAVSTCVSLAVTLVAPLVNATEQSSAPPTAASAPASSIPPSIAAPDLALGVAPQPTPEPGAGHAATSAAASNDAESPASADSADSSADDATARDGNQIAIYGQVLGSAVMLGPGVSYRALDTFALDFGIGYFNFCFLSCSEGITPSLQLSWLSGGNHNFEVGLGVAVSFVTDSESRPLIGPHLGYRYQPTDGGFFFRALIHAPYIVTADTLLPWPGFAFGVNIGD